MNAYKEIEKISEFQKQEIKRILDDLPLFEIVEQTSSTLSVREEAKNCISMKDLLRNWELIKEDNGIILFHKRLDADITYEERLHQK